MDWDVDLSCLISFGSCNLLNFDAVLLSVNGFDLALLTLGSFSIITNLDNDGVTLSHRERAALVLGSELA